MYEMQKILFSIWIRVAVSVSYDRKHYTTKASRKKEYAYHLIRLNERQYAHESKRITT